MVILIEIGDQKTAIRLMETKKLRKLKVDNLPNQPQISAVLVKANSANRLRTITERRY